MIAFLFGALLVPGNQAVSKPDFQSTIASILQQHCVQCHHSGKLNLTSRDSVLNGKLIVAGQPEASPLYTSMRSGTMPPSGKLSDPEIEQIGAWIRAGAAWPDNFAIEVPKGASAVSGNASTEFENVKKIRARIETKAAHKDSKAYSVTIPNTTVAYNMVPIPAGKFLMGSKEQADEQPQHEVALDGFWMQANEVTWDEYRLFMFANQAGEIASKDDAVDAVSRPTRPYVEMSFGMGINGFPAISMTQHAANKYAEWLSAKTGEFYRLPTEAEWEYACRAGASTPYYFGSDPALLKDYAWYSANSGGKYQKVGTKKPNLWGLYDMLGNVMEWTLDAYAPYRPDHDSDPWVKPSAPYPMSVRGGSWNDDAPAVTCASRVASDPSWKQQDPQLPKSIWYETDAQWLGFRLIRPAKLPSAEEMFKYWNNGVEHDEQ